MEYQSFKQNHMCSTCGLQVEDGDSKETAKVHGYGPHYFLVNLWEMLCFCGFPLSQLHSSTKWRIIENKALLGVWDFHSPSYLCGTVTIEIGILEINPLPAIYKIGLGSTSVSRHGSPLYWKLTIQPCVNNYFSTRGIINKVSFTRTKYCYKLFIVLYC